ncbi:hypothetical protein MWU57_00920 [Isoptericola sp. S6320L]|uniref:hypothetical protein n=1 Tax=Isoptericola sp. S6320L TaxID=2926411 RepID=UPI001FF26BD6|nr:hypothetical protein [Isoptericola sp. S6320L]MCK0115586.1 hypothetical protein [Isoptericola sp. S6320L]
MFAVVRVEPVELEAAECADALGDREGPLKVIVDGVDPRPVASADADDLALRIDHGDDAFVFAGIRPTP